MTTIAAYKNVVFVDECVVEGSRTRYEQKYLAGDYCVLVYGGYLPSIETRREDLACVESALMVAAKNGADPKLCLSPRDNEDFSTDAFVVTRDGIYIIDCETCLEPTPIAPTHPDCPIFCGTGGRIMWMLLAAGIKPTKAWEHVLAYDNVSGGKLHAIDPRKLKPLVATEI